jgi:hypothetical protein
MTELVLTNAQVLVNSVDLSDHILDVKLTYKAELQDDTAMGLGTRSRTPGLLDWTVALTAKNDFAAANVDATIFPLIGAAPFAIEIRPVKAARSATNPGYNGNVVVSTDDPISGAIGKLLTRTTLFEAAGPLARSLV